MVISIEILKADIDVLEQQVLANNTPDNRSNLNKTKAEYM